MVGVVKGLNVLWHVVACNERVEIELFDFVCAIIYSVWQVEDALFVYLWRLSLLALCFPVNTHTR